MRSIVWFVAQGFRPKSGNLDRIECSILSLVQHIEVDRKQQGKQPQHTLSGIQDLQERSEASQCSIHPN